MTLTTRIFAYIDALEQVAGDVEYSESRFAARDPILLLTGTGASLADVKFSDTRTLAASATETLDFNGLTDSLGRTANFVKVKALLVVAASGNTNSVIIGNVANSFLGPLDQLSDTVTLPPGGLYMIAAPVAGWASTNGAFDKLKVANSSSGTSVDYSIYVIGTSA